MLLDSKEIEKGNYKEGNSLIEDNLIIVYFFHESPSYESTRIFSLSENKKYSAND